MTSRPSDPPGEVHAAEGRLQLLHERGAAGPRGGLPYEHVSGSGSIPMTSGSGSGTLQKKQLFKTVNIDFLPSADPPGEVHAAEGRLQLLHERGAAGPRGGAALRGRPCLHGCHPSTMVGRRAPADCQASHSGDSSGAKCVRTSQQK